MPREHRETQYRLGNLYFTNQQWAEAYKAYDVALQAGEVAYHASATRAARQGELQRAGFMPIRAAYCLAKMRRYAEAVETLEQGLARSLAESLDLDEAALQHATPEDQAVFNTASDRIKLLDAEARSAGQPAVRSFIEVSTAMQMARQELETLVNRIRSYAPDFMPAQRTFNGIAATANELGEPLVYLLATPHGSLALTVPPGVETLNEEHAIWLDKMPTDYLKNMLSDRDATTWGYLHCVAGDKTEEILKRILRETLPGLEANVMAPIVQYLTSHGYCQAILLPSDPFGLLPLAALTSETLTLSVAPSARALQGAQQAAQERAALHSVLVGVGNPLPNPKPLSFARMGVEQIARLFEPNARRLFFETKASLESVRKALPGATHLHLYCHGRFNVATPLESALSLAGDDQLTLRQLLDGDLDLSSLKLVVLSACQTGLTDFWTVPDEAIGFPAGFLEAGVPGVVGTLWSVEENSTALLLAKFYDFHLRERMNPPTALHKAQIWLRQVTGAELAASFQRQYQESNMRNKDAWVQMRYYQTQPDRTPFDHPYYWAAFYFSGVGV